MIFVKMVWFFLANVMRKRPLYVYVGCIVLLYFRFSVMPDISDWSLENLRSDALSWAHFLGVWLLVFLNGAIFEEVYSKRNIDSILSLGVKRSVVFCAAIAAVMVMLFLWISIVISISLLVIGGEPLFVGRQLLSFFAAGYSILMVQAFALILMSRLPVTSGALLSVVVYIFGGSVIGVLPPWLPAWLMPLGNRVQSDLSLFLMRGIYRSSVSHAMFGVTLWFLGASIWSTRSFVRRDLS